MDKIITLANIAAGLSVQKIGSRLSIPSLSEVLDYYTKKMGMVNQAPAPNNGGAPQQQMQTPPPSNGQ